MSGPRRTVNAERSGLHMKGEHWGVTGQFQQHAQVYALIKSFCLLSGAQHNKQGNKPTLTDLTVSPSLNVSGGHPPFQRGPDTSWDQQAREWRVWYQYCPGLSR